jgi:hypothetical protein
MVSAATARSTVIAANTAGKQVTVTVQGDTGGPYSYTGTARFLPGSSTRLLLLGVQVPRDGYLTHSSDGNDYDLTGHSGPVFPLRDSAVEATGTLTRGPARRTYDSDGPIVDNIGTTMIFDVVADVLTIAQAVANADTTLGKRRTPTGTLEADPTWTYGDGRS